MSAYNPENLTYPKDKESQALEPMPERCTSQKCFSRPRKTMIGVVEVQNQTGEYEILPAGYVFPQQGAGAKRSFRHGYDFVRWHTRCLMCFYDEPVLCSKTWQGN